MKKIKSARITALPQSFTDDMPQVWVILEGEENETYLFEYYPDEISFSSSEFIGLTISAANELKRSKIAAYIRKE